MPNTLMSAFRDKLPPVWLRLSQDVTVLADRGRVRESRDSWVQGLRFDSMRRFGLDSLRFLFRV